MSVGVCRVSAASAKLTGAMAATVVYVVLLFAILAAAQYNDDSDYNDFDFYENLPTSYERNANDNYRATGPDDFYIISEFEDANRQGPNDLVVEDIPVIVEKKIPAKALPGSSQRQRDWYKRTEKVYRYTKHRIPGYDYDELDFMASRSLQECDRKSIWTNCLCQFTCYEPNVVDCFTPCRSGCECKEDYVFDEKTEQCILPGQCTNAKDYILYKK